MSKGIRRTIAEPTEAELAVYLPLVREFIKAVGEDVGYSISMCSTASTNDQVTKRRRERKEAKVKKAQEIISANPLGYGLHRRWHVNRKIVNPECDFCTQKIK